MPFWKYIKAGAKFATGAIRAESPVFETGARAGWAISRAHVGDRMLIGAILGAGTNAAFGDSDVPLGRRLTRGALAGGFLGLAVYPALYSAGALGEGIFRAGKAGVPAVGRRIGRYFGRGYSRFMENPSLGQLYKSFGTTGGFMMAGTAIGGYVGAQTGHPFKGMLYGAGVGLGAKGTAEFFSLYSKAGKLGQAGLIAGGVAGVFGIASVAQPPDLSQSVVVTPDIAGLPEYGPPGSGLQERLRSMNATGDIVLGLHGRRR